MIKKKTPMSMLDKDLRISTFDEVNLGYSIEEAIDEAHRCLQCKHKPCVEGCPVHIDIPGFIQAVTQKQFDQAYEIIHQSSCLPAVCGRVCPQEIQCEAKCVCGIKGDSVAIGHLERFVADQYYRNHTSNSKKSDSLNKIAVIGSGPAGLSCAHDLSNYGCRVDVYEALHLAGGVLSYGIPAFRLPKEVVEREVLELKNQGVQFIHNVIIGKTLTIDDLNHMGYQAIFIGTGAGLPKFMNIPGEMYNGVYSANEFLTRVNLMKAYDEQSETPIKKGKRVAVIGGGNVALDAARSALRLGADQVYIVYRRSMNELPARHEEVIHAQEEGIIFQLLTNIKEILGDNQGHVIGIKCCKMTLGEPDASGRRKPIENQDEHLIIEVDEVIMAIGTTPNPLIFEGSHQFESDAHGCLLINHETQETTINNVYAGGDIVSGSATVILAMEAGRLAAKAIHQKLSMQN